MLMSNHETSSHDVTSMDDIAAIDKEIETLLSELVETCGDDGEVCSPFLFAEDQITAKTVDNVFDALQDRIGLDNDQGHLIVVVDSSGGDIDAAYNLALLFQRYSPKRLTYIVPRWAKSAATLLVCGGNSVMMTPVAELGPLDPQITQMNPLEERLESFSPLHIESTLELIQKEFAQGHTALAEGLLQRLQFPITLGGFKQSLEIGKQYANNLLSSRMLKGKEASARQIATRLVQDYANHGFCINIDEARSLGLTVDELSHSQFRIVWRIYKLVRRKTELQTAQYKQDMTEQLKRLPPALLDELLPEIARPETSPDTQGGDDES